MSAEHERVLLLVEMLNERRAQWDMHASKLEGFEAAIDVITEWRGMVNAPLKKPRETMVLGDVGCDDDQAADGSVTR